MVEKSIFCIGKLCIPDALTKMMNIVDILINDDFGIMAFDDIITQYGSSLHRMQFIKVAYCIFKGVNVDVEDIQCIGVLIQIL